MARHLRGRSLRRARRFRGGRITRPRRKMQDVDVARSRIVLLGFGRSALTRIERHG